VSFFEYLAQHPVAFGVYLAIFMGGLALIVEASKWNGK